MSNISNHSRVVRFFLKDQANIIEPPTITLPASKSLSNRALILAAQAEGDVLLDNLSQAQDTAVLLEALQNMKTKTSRVDINLEGAGSALRFLTALCAIRPGEYLIDGNTQLRARPIVDLLHLLRELGADINPLGPNQGLPLMVRGKALQGRKLEIQGKQTSQFVSALLLTAPSFLGGLEIHLDRSKQVSFSYIELTLAMMTKFGVRYSIESSSNRVVIKIPEQKIRMSNKIHIEADAASASYFAAASYILNRPVMLEGIFLESQQPEIEFFRILSRHGLPMQQTEKSLLVQGFKTLPSIRCDMNDCSDTAMTMGVLACFFEGESSIRGIAHNRWKESNRIEAFVDELYALGYKAQATDDGFKITGQISRLVETHLCRTHEDHRMIMALSLLALKNPGIAIENPLAVVKSFPNYFYELEKLGIQNTFEDS